MSGARIHPDDDLLRALCRSADPDDRRLATVLAPLKPHRHVTPAASPALATFLAGGSTAPGPGPVLLVELGAARVPAPTRPRRRFGLRLALGAALAVMTVGVAAAATGVLPVRDDSVVVTPADHDPRGHDTTGPVDRDDRQPVGHPQPVPQHGSGSAADPAGTQPGARSAGSTGPSTAVAPSGTGVTNPRSGGSDGSGDTAEPADGGSGDGGSGDGADGGGSGADSTLTGSDAAVTPPADGSGD